MAVEGVVVVGTSGRHKPPQMRQYPGLQSHPGIPASVGGNNGQTPLNRRSHLHSDLHVLTDVTKVALGSIGSRNAKKFIKKVKGKLSSIN